MKVLYINLSDCPISSSDELINLNHNLIDDFFFYLGDKIANGCKVPNENALITDFDTLDNKQDYDAIISQWNEIKRLLFAESVSGTFRFELPFGYLHWLHYNEDYNHIYDKNFSNERDGSIIIDLEELYEDSIKALLRKIELKIRTDKQYRDIEIIVFNDGVVSENSLIINYIRDNFESIVVLTLKEWNERVRVEQERIEQERIEQERIEQERIEQERIEQERIEQERIEQERIERERIEQERKLSNEFLSYNEFYIFCEVFPKIFHHVYNNDLNERSLLLLKLREQFSHILEGKSFCLNPYSSETYDDPRSPFYGGRPQLLYFTQKDFQKMSFFEKLCKLSKGYGIDWKFDEDMLQKLYDVAIRYRNENGDKIEIQIPYITTRNNDFVNIKKRTTLWKIHDSTYTYVRILKY